MKDNGKSRYNSLCEVVIPEDGRVHVEFRTLRYEATDADKTLQSKVIPQEVNILHEKYGAPMIGFRVVSTHEVS